MKYVITLTLLFFSLNIFAQKPCEYNTNVTDSLGTYKSTKEYMISEKNFAGNSSYIFYSLALTDGLPTLSVQIIQKSKDFLKANCFDKNSKLFLQLNNGKIITLIHIDQENCGTMLRDDKGFDNRVNSGIFMFMKDSFEELKNSPVSMMRIKYLTDTEDYILKKEFKSELTNEIYNPENYFINNLKCIE
ncbi:hypothetical protein [Flavobacterium yafengii]|jgi:hypothetical protein|uniref:Uncharacterized protein n=1 Tax=Flavobacterium yafengii TaxID=3041253 RepID=A0AAW6TRG9_9FLAO|nr:hypothetical protein [Flavobacterium yafengii]MDI5897058.1 hypothetical protein [Flavobacterium yafengii]MDI5949985.1 hypothetical protein [Flavobacterium yafengii]MDI6046271.1 hypothetical protein [Flavobacterium yafengii]